MVIPIVISWINLTMIQKNLLKIMNTYNLKQVINDYTRVTSTTKTCIDHILTNRPDCVFQSGEID